MLIIVNDPLTIKRYMICFVLFISNPSDIQELISKIYSKLWYDGHIVFNKQTIENISYDIPFQKYCFIIKDKVYSIDQLWIINRRHWIIVLTEWTNRALLLLSTEWIAIILIKRSGAVVLSGCTLRVWYAEYWSLCRVLLIHAGSFVWDRMKPGM